MEDKLKNKKGVDAKSGPTMSTIMQEYRKMKDYCPPGFIREEYDKKIKEIE